MNIIVTIARNSLSSTKSAVDSFGKQDIETNTLVINNASSDGTSSWLQSRHDLFSVNFIHQRSVAQCWNFALKWIFGSMKEKAALVCGNDTELLPQTYRLLLETGYPFVTGVGSNNRTSVFKRRAKSWKPEDVNNHPDFSCFLIRKEVWEKVGPFDERFEKAYCEDLAYHIEMFKKGIVARKVGVPFFHAFSGTSKNASLAEQKAIQIQAEKNRQLFKKLYGVEVGSKEYYAIFGEVV